jgi:hypothetical protein
MQPFGAGSVAPSFNLYPEHGFQFAPTLWRGPISPETALHTYAIVLYIYTCVVPVSEPRLFIFLHQEWLSGK